MADRKAIREYFAHQERLATWEVEDAAWRIEYRHADAALEAAKAVARTEIVATKRFYRWPIIVVGLFFVLSWIMEKWLLPLVPGGSLPSDMKDGVVIATRLLFYPFFGLLGLLVFLRLSAESRVMSTVNRSLPSRPSKPNLSAAHSKVDEAKADDLSSLKRMANEMMGSRQASPTLKQFEEECLVDERRLNRWAPLRIQEGVDGKIRRTPIGYAKIAFSEEQIIMYEGAVDLRTGAFSYQTVREFFYQDVVSISRTRQEDVYEIGKDEFKVVRELFQLDLASGDNVKIGMREYKASDGTSAGVATAQQTYQQMCGELRDKKKAILGKAAVKA
jgi:hypothetical protein